MDSALWLLLWLRFRAWLRRLVRSAATLRGALFLAAGLLFFALVIGPNGAGKTTTLRTLAGILKPTAGRIVIDGHDLASDPLGAKRRLAFMPDEPHLFEYLTVEEHLRLMARLYEVRDFEARAAALLEELELSGREKLLPGELSRGMRQKVAIGCGYLHNPRAVLLDEPLTGLDPQGIRTMKELIREYAAAGAATMVSSHLLSLFEDLVTSVLILNRGRVVRHGRLADLRAEAAAEGGEGRWRRCSSG